MQILCNLFLSLFLESGVELSYVELTRSIQYNGAGDHSKEHTF